MKFAWPYATMDGEKQKRLEITICSKDGCRTARFWEKEWLLINPHFSICRDEISGFRSRARIPDRQWRNLIK